MQTCKLASSACLFTVLSFVSFSNYANGIVKDIDGNQYATIKTGNVEWMAENLKVTRTADGTKLTSFYPGDQETRMHKYGLLYDFATAKKACPSGWQLPSNNDWMNLLKQKLIGHAEVYKHSGSWKQEQNTNKSGFSALPSGYGNTEHPNNFDESGTYFSRDMEDDEFVWTFQFKLGSHDIRKVSQHLHYGFSVRCIRYMDN